MDAGGRATSRSVAWQAAFALGIAFTQVDDATALEVLGAALGGPVERAAVRRHVACLASVDEGTRDRALDLLGALDRTRGVRAVGRALPA